MGAVKDVTSAILPYAMLAGVAAVIYIKRDAIVNWLKGTLVPDSLVTDTDGDNWNDAGTGVIDANKPLWEGSLLCHMFPSLCNGNASGTLTESESAEMWAAFEAAQQRLTESSARYAEETAWQNDCIARGGVPSYPNGVRSCTLPGYIPPELDDNVTSNIVTGDAAAAYAHARALEAAAAVPSTGWNFQTIRSLIEADGYTEIPLSPVLALGINQYGWDVHYTTDTGPWHEGQISRMVSGGDNPFGGAVFDAYLQQAVQYSGVV